MRFGKARLPCGTDAPAAWSSRAVARSRSTSGLGPSPYVFSLRPRAPRSTSGAGPGDLGVDEPDRTAWFGPARRGASVEPPIVLDRLGPPPVPRSTGGVEVGRAGAVMMRKGGSDGALGKATCRTIGGSDPAGSVAARDPSVRDDLAHLVEINGHAEVDQVFTPDPTPGPVERRHRRRRR